MQMIYYCFLCIFSHKGCKFSICCSYQARLISILANLMQPCNRVRSICTDSPFPTIILQKEYNEITIGILITTINYSL